MTQLEQQMIDELIVTQGFTNNLAANLNSKGVPSTSDEGLDTLVPKVLQIESGDAQTPYDEWQEGFGVNWDSVVANAPMTYTQRILHIYTKVEFLKMISTFPTSAEIYTFNGSVYRQITMDANKRLAFIEADYMTNSFDNLQYVCVVYGEYSWGTAVFNVWLPVVYGNSKAVTSGSADKEVNLLNDYINNYRPTLRGVDINFLAQNNIFGGLEYLTYQSISQPLAFRYEGLRNCEIRVLKEVCDTLPSGLTYSTANNFSEVNVRVTDEALADWFYNTWLYTIYASGTRFSYPVGNYVRKFKVNSAMQLKAGGGNTYIYGIPNCDYLEGTFTEDQTSTSPGLHRFSSNNMRNLINFPMWTVLDGASTGCLLPTSSLSSYANFIFYSTNLERKYFCEFDENGTIIENPTKYFLCNLPVQQYVTGQSVRFVTNAFWSLFTANEISEIERYIGLKNWAIIWQ